MPKYTVSGVDEETGMQTSMVLEAPSQEEAVRVGISRGIRPVRSDAQLPASHADIARLVEEIQELRRDVQRSDAWFLNDLAARQRLGSVIAGGIVKGLLLWILLPFVCLVFVATVCYSAAGWLWLSHR